MKLNRVVVTGYGVTSPIGNTPEEFWNSLTTGKIGIGPITKFDHSDFDVHNAAEIQDFPLINTLLRKIPIVSITILCMPCTQLKKPLIMQVLM